MKNIEEFNSFLSKNNAVVAYFSHEECNVCKVLKPKLISLLKESFPKIAFTYINIKETPEIPAQLSIFTVPTIVVYFEGKEFIRKSRSIGIEELADSIYRPYELMFN
jgi:thioredoxin